MKKILKIKKKKGMVGEIALIVGLATGAMSVIMVSVIAPFGLILAPVVAGELWNNERARKNKLEIAKIYGNSDAQPVVVQKS